MASSPLPESDIEDGDHEVDGQPSGASLEDVHERAMDRFDSVAVPQREMRQNSLAARRFSTIKGAQWEDDIWAQQFENAPRPEVDKIGKSMRKIDSDYRQNRMMVDFRPADDKADEDTAEFMDGLYRADFYRCKGHLAHDNAWREGLKGGFGAWRISTDYEDEYDPDNDHQRVLPAIVVPDADQRVYFDIGSVLQDHSDAKWAFIIHVDPRAEAERKWGAENLDPWPLANWRWNWDWYRPDTVQFAEYYEVEETDDTLYIFTNRFTDEEERLFASEMQDGQLAERKATGWKVRTREMKRRRVHRYIMNGMKVLKDCGLIAGRRIPIVPFYADFEFVDGMIRFRGYVEPRMDEQRIYNSQMSRLVEISGSSAGDLPMIDPARVPPGPMQDAWANRSIGRPAYLPLLPQMDSDGNILKTDVDFLPAPQAPPTTVALLQITGQGLEEQNDTTDQVQSNVSAEAMELAQNRVDERSGPFLDNFRIAVQCEGEICQPIMGEIYIEPERKVATMDLDGNTSMATLAESILGPDNVYRKRNDIMRGKYSVVASVQESTATKRDKTVRQAMNLAQVAITAQDMQLAGAALLTAVEQMDGEGMQKLQDFAHKKAVSIGLDDPTDEEKQEMQQAASQQQPDPAAQALMGQAAKLNADAGLSKAKSIQTLADAALKHAQADELMKAPKVPSGLSTPPDPVDPVDQVDKLAGARLKVAQADKLQQDASRADSEHVHQRIKTGHQIEMERRQQDLAERAQGHAESQPQGGVE